jgi:hypothetical protein
MEYLQRSLDVYRNVEMSRALQNDATGFAPALGI